MPSSSLDPIVVENLQAALNRSGRSAYSVATALGRAPNWLYQILKKKNGILIPNLREVANELGVSLGSLVDPAPGTPNEDGTPQRGAGAQVSSLSGGQVQQGQSVVTQGTSDSNFEEPYTAFDDQIVSFAYDLPSGVDTLDQIGTTVYLWEIKCEPGFDGDLTLDSPPSHLWEKVTHAIVPAKTGYVSVNDSGRHNNLVDPIKCLVVKVPGRSMEPTLPEGCIVVVDTNKGRRGRRAGRIFLVHVYQGMIVKRTGRGPRGYWQLVSDNLDWKTVLWPHDAWIVGEVRWMSKMNYGAMW